MDYLRFVKIFIYSTIQIILFSTGMFGFIMSLEYWTPEYLNLEYDYLLNNALPINIQFYRILAYGSLVLSIFIWIISFLNIRKIEDEKMKRNFTYSLGIFTWILTPYILYKCINEKYFPKYFHYISQDYTSIKTISLFEKTQNKYLCFNTIFGIFVWLVSLVGFILLFVAPEYYDAQNPKTNFLIGSLSYFTNLNNWGVFFFMTFYLLFNKKMAFKNNTIMIGMSAYIFIVGGFFWLALFPYSLEGIEKTYRLSEDGPLGLISTIFVHLITPLFFVIFSISSFYLSKEAPKSFLKTISKLIVFPIVYGLYIFALPFFTQFSVYGNLTNLNPNCIPYYDAVFNDDPYKNGSWSNLGILFGLIALFVFMIFAFWFICMKVNKKKIRDNWK